MKKRIVVAGVFALLLTAAAYSQAVAQNMDFLELAKKGTPQEVLDAIRHGANPDAADPNNFMTPLMYAAEYNSFATVVALVRAGADMYATDVRPGTEQTEQTGKTFVDYARENQSLKDSEVAKLTSIYEKTGPLFELFYNTYSKPTPKQVQAAIENGAEVNAHRTAAIFAPGDSPLMSAVQMVWTYPEFVDTKLSSILEG